MNFRTAEQANHEFQIAPLIDIVFLLLVFFIVTYSMSQIERELGIELPEAASATEQTSRFREIVVNVNAEGGIVVNRQTMTPEDLANRLKRLAGFEDPPLPPNVIIRADGACEHRDVMAAVDACAQAGVRNVYFGTKDHAQTTVGTEIPDAPRP